MGLFPHQAKIIDDARDYFRNGAERVCIQSPTGSGKTYIFAEIVKNLLANDQRAWIMVPRNELLEQASDHLSAFGVPHGRIAAGIEESSAFKVHVVSKDTLIRRYDSIKKPPDWLVIDECHIALERQIEIFQKMLEIAKNLAKDGEDPKLNMIGFTATPERGDGRGLIELYQHLVLGERISNLVELGYLAEPEYFCPPLHGLDKLKRSGPEYAAGELSALLEERMIYGQAIKHYERHARGRTSIVFTRSVKDAQKTAKQYRDAGYSFESIDGKMKKEMRKDLIEALKDGRIQGLVSCDLLTYGVDIPNVSCITLLRPTLSKALHYQMIGRGLRRADGKSNCIIFDHVNNYLTHGHPLEHYEWRFTGREKKVSEPGDPEAIARLCPELDFLYCTKPSCAGCPHNKSGTSRKEKKFKIIEAELEKIKSPVKLNERPPIQKAIYQERILKAIDAFEKNPYDKGPIADLMAVASENKFKPLWVYWKLSEGRNSCNVPLLHEMARIGEYHRGWAPRMQEFISNKLDKERVR